MIDKYYFDNVPSKNILTDYKPKDLSSTLQENYPSGSIENMIINSNLDNGTNIK